MTIGLVDTKFCNLSSVVNALEFCDLNYKIVENWKQLDDCQRIILPGVGSYKHAMNHLNDVGFSDELRKQVFEKNKPFLGICLGMQMLSDFSSEDGGEVGLKIVPGNVIKLDETDAGSRVPNIGWANVSLDQDCKLFKSIENGSSFYHIHSFFYQPEEKNAIKATIKFADEDICVGIQQNNVFGVQFHPEKSHAAGLQIFKNFHEV